MSRALFSAVVFVTSLTAFATPRWPTHRPFFFLLSPLDRPVPRVPHLHIPALSPALTRLA